MRHTGEAQSGNGDLGEVDHRKDASTAVQSAGGRARTLVELNNYQHNSSLHLPFDKFFIALNFTSLLLVNVSNLAPSRTISTDALHVIA
jgi:hypothetical protein